MGVFVDTEESLLQELALNPMSTMRWEKLLAIYMRWGDTMKAEIAMVGVMYGKPLSDEQIVRRWLGLYIMNRVETAGIRSGSQAKKKLMVDAQVILDAMAKVKADHERWLSETRHLVFNLRQPSVTAKNA